MAALLVALAILSVVMLVALPTWRQQSQREKEAELIFRGEQYARAIALYQRKLAGAFPPNLDVLVEQKFLRRKYKDPITGDDFLPVYAGATGLGELIDGLGGAGRAPDAGAPRQSAPAGPGGVQTRQTPGGQSSSTPFGQVGPGGISGRPGMPQGATGIVGVVSKSNASSIRLYNGRNKYDQWIFVYSAVGQQPQPPGQPLPLGGQAPAGGQPPSPGRGSVR